MARSLFWGLFLRVIIESFVIGILCCLLNLRLLDFSHDKWTFANALLTLVLAPVLALFPFVAVCWMYKNWATL